MGAHSDVNVLGHGRESPHGELITKKIDIIDRLYRSSDCSLPNVRREHRSPQSGDYGRPQHDIAEVMVLWAVVSRGDIGPGFVIPHLAVKEVQTDAVSSVLTSLLGVKVVERAPVIFVDVPVLDKYALARR